jgi:hypothetical protein
VQQAYNVNMRRPAKLVIVQTFNTRPEADIAKSALAAANVEAMIQADTAGGMREHLAWSGGGYKVLVREEDAASARDVLAPRPPRKR